MAVHGADAGNLRTLADELSRAARRLESVRMDLGQQLGLPLGWRGPGAERFGQQWRYEGSRHLTSAVAGLDNAAAGAAPKRARAGGGQWGGLRRGADGTSGCVLG
ncbi:MAG: hypothetical protein SV966_05405 [Actinomycetota bacterium]|nr:hypothetical protein [Actinomycetota bacterium]